jgi:hypothetical protein
MPTAPAQLKQISWRLVKFNATFVLMPLKFFGTATEIAISILLPVMK